jgi:hypothetical protein
MDPGLPGRVNAGEVRPDDLLCSTPEDILAAAAAAAGGPRRAARSLAP